MAIASDIVKKKKKTTERKTVYSSGTDDIEVLKNLAQEKGYKLKEKKPSLFKRTIDVISRPLYASANLAKDIVNKGKFTPLQSLKKGITGEEKTTYSDVLSEMGVKNKWVKGGVGFALDVALDPTTYFGGSLIKGASKVVGKGLTKVGKAYSKVAPESAEAFAQAGKKLKEGVSGAFSIYGGNRSKKLVDDAFIQLNKLRQAKENVIDDIVYRFGKNVDDKKLERAGEYVYNNRLIERGLKKGEIKYPQDPQTRELVTAIKKLGKELGQEAGLKEKAVLQTGKVAEKLDPLAQEARKGEVYYHGTPAGFETKDFKGGYLTKDKNYADVYQGKSASSISYGSEGVKNKASGIPRTLEFVMGKDANLFDYTNPKHRALLKDYFGKSSMSSEPAVGRSGQLDWTEGENLADYFKEKGIKFDGIKLDEAGGIDPMSGLEVKRSPSVLITNPKVLKENIKSQLTDLWNKEMKGAGEVGKKVKGTMDEWYFPGLDEMRLKPTGKESKIFGVGKEGYKKEFKGLIEEGRRVKDVREAFGRRFFEVARDKMNTRFLDDIVKQYGSKTAQEGMMAIYRKAPKIIMKEGQTFATKPIGFLKEADAKFINNILFPEMKSIDLLAKGIGYDAFTNLFKTAVTAYFPAFHIRNYLSGMVQNYQVLGARALAPANINTGLAILKKSNKALNFKNFKGTAKELGEAMDTRFGSSSRYISDIGDYIDQLANNKFKVKKISKARQVGAFVEMNQKANAVATALRKGHTVDEALDLAEKAGFDYTKITPFESKVMKRLIPFYTFARKNAQLQAETFVKHPERIINQSKLANAFSNMFGGKTTEEDIKGLPNWAVEGLGFKIKEGKYLTKFGLPLEEFIQRLNKPMMSTLSSLNPIIKYPVESKLGYDFFREQKITDVNKIAPASGEMLLKAKENGLMPEWLDNALNINKYEYKGKTYYNASPKALHLLRNIPTARLENTLEKIFNKDMGKVDKYMAFFSGSKIYDIDIEMQKYFQERDLKRDIEDYLLGKGVGSKFETFNIYKNEQ